MGDHAPCGEQLSQIQAAAAQQRCPTSDVQTGQAKTLVGQLQFVGGTCHSKPTA